MHFAREMAPAVENALPGISSFSTAGDAIRNFFILPVFIFEAVKGDGARDFAVYLWHNNPVGIGMQDNFCFAGGKKRQTFLPQKASDH